jgi:hypothetical protein
LQYCVTAKPSPFLVLVLRSLSRKREASKDVPEGAVLCILRNLSHRSRPFAFGKGRLRMRAVEETPIFEADLGSYNIAQEGA